MVNSNILSEFKKVYQNKRVRNIRNNEVYSVLDILNNSMDTSEKYKVDFQLQPILGGASFLQDELYFLANYKLI